MIRSLLRAHPDHAVLSQVADRELPAAELMQVNAHLAECRECREAVDFMVELRRRLQNLAGPEPDETILTEILRRRAAGERTILVADQPVEEVVPSRTVRPAVSAAAMVALFGGGFAFFAVGGAEAGLNRLVPDVSPAGTVMGFTFETTGPFIEEDRLRLRAAYHDRPGRPWESTPLNAVDMDLVRTGRSTFESSRALPASVVYARFAVETSDGEIVPAAGDGREHLALGPDGLPTLEALIHRLRFEYEIAKNDRAALETARVLTTRFGSQPIAWYWRCFVECPSADQTLRAMHERRLRRFHAELPADPSADRLATLAYYAREVDEQSPYLERLFARLEAIAPQHPALNGRRVERAVRLVGDARLAELERLWDIGHDMSSDVFVPAFMAAAQEGDEIALRWYDRWIVTHPPARLEAAQWLARLTAPSPPVVDRLHQAVRWADEGNIRRPLGRSVAEHRWDVDSGKLALSIPVARYLLEAGRPRAALHEISWAGDLFLRPEVVELFVELSHSLDHSERAVEYRVFGSVLPLRSEERKRADREALLGMGLGPEELERRTREARGRLLARALRGTVPTYVEGPVMVEDAGRARDLMSDLGPVTILQFGSARSSSTRERLRSLATRCPLLDEHGIRILPIFDESPAGHGGVTATCASNPLVDARGDARTGLATHFFLEIVVLDQEGRVRFRGSDPDAALRAAILLAETA
ncbi:MAG: zf-HC2 domain-containing protein [Gemmatimonadota bacterium]|nr:zf-HC2 domain-containing protein [Gemmatimonadota bacterium]